MRNEGGFMLRGTLLLVDNKPDFLRTRAELLEQGGYRVLIASTVAEAKQILAENLIDLAIIDIRLENDDDENDVSGLILAKKIPSWIPKMILTNYPTVNLVREAFRDIGAIDFIAKEEERPELFEAIHKALLRNVFVVHGHDNEILQTVIAFLQKMDLRPIVLRDLPDGGQAIFDKLEAAANVAFSVVLFTPDDVGGRQGSEALTARARENVIFELGYFLGKLGKQKVRVLYKADTNIPSDYQGILYIPIDPTDGTSWQLSLAREMKAVGLNIDFNKLA